eukprot:Gregarina_sp_Poly_1__2266@NODE_1600_length_3746_cov_138_343028_g1054_i0_p2_GENE_NODE_1600_length_3746_cov_138_343028_g1054_i0NODE_1600_length_3746_cov_138_343028_g1054_i0_p2_ORF_typecomplete_len167_score24_90_NODE_1600_length_3746_cov_138_343028_g1054_i032123712
MRNVVLTILICSLGSGESHNLPTVHAKSRVFHYARIFASYEPELRNQYTGNDTLAEDILMAESRAQSSAELNKIQKLREKGFPTKIIVSVKESANLDEVSERIKGSLQNYGAEIDGVMSMLRMFVLKFGTPSISNNYKELDIEALELIKEDADVKFCEVDSVVEAL